MDDDFGLADFQHYKKSADIIKKEREFHGHSVSDGITKPEIQKNRIESRRIVEDGGGNNRNIHENGGSNSRTDENDGRQNLIVDVNTDESQISTDSLASYATLKEPLVFHSKLTNPYLNLAVEDYIYNKMPIATTGNYNRLLFYVNQPCVVIGKNQNPWKEVNLPLLTSLQIPLVRRRSGGGTVVHDTGNVNYSFMTTKEAFDRFTFAHLVADSVNSLKGKQIKVNERGDLVTAEDNLKISGLAYKLSRGKSYHHGTMLLSLKLDVLKRLLHRDTSKLGVVDAMNSISSVPAKVGNLGFTPNEFASAVADGFDVAYGVEKESDEQDEVYDQDAMFGFNHFMPQVQHVEITEDMLPQEVHDTAADLKQWSWRYGNTPRFSHEITNEKLGFTVKFLVNKGAIVELFELTFNGPVKKEIVDSFAYLKVFVEENDLEYMGSNVAGFITNDEISDWLGMAIDGTI